MDHECPSTVPWKPAEGGRFRQAREQFRAAWRAGERPRLEEYLEQASDSDRANWLFDLLGVELEIRIGAGEQPSQTEYETRFATHADAVAAVFGHKGLTVPARIGRYQALRRLGGGGFGHVYLCFDERARRQVAIKVPRADRFTSAEALDAFLREARNVARLDHANIVPLFDIVEEAGHCFLVYKYIDGQSLLELLSKSPLSFERSATIVAEIADALQHAHSKNVFHRDIKPGNILLDQEGRPYITDFGLAVPEEDLPQARGHRSGTLPYMSPEQIRGEGHRIDGRTDIYSLGVLFYELLTGRRPFAGKDDEVMEQVLFRDPRPPRQIRDTVPREFERICTRAMAKQMNTRYATARDMADEVRQALAWLKMGGAVPVPSTIDQAMPGVASDKRSGSGSSQPLFLIVPKGLRSYGPEDRDFFLQLLPGIRDREGLPESLSFWKARVESRDAERSFAVGLLYGPSGCGKSSLIKAGLLPRLSNKVKPIYLEATAQDTEQRLVKALRQAFPEFGPELTAVEILFQLRKGRYLPPDTKVLIVLDQFEQWLHTHGPDMETSAMLAALRHADGHNVSVLLLVRDDFWMGVSRLFDLLEINLDREGNARAVDLFDLQHARKVLVQFGQAFERLPLSMRELSEDQGRFLDRAVQQLSEDGRVISVRLSLFADLMKDRPWTTASLIEVGGAEGVGVRFLEETFSRRTALPDLRALEKPVRALLQALLPDRGTDIKGRLRSRQELAVACGLEEQSPRLSRLLEILDRELHIITPTEAAGESGVETKTGDSSPSLPRVATPSYQLTHDYMVPSLRQWLTQERQKTWRGRAEMCLEERTAQWSRTKDKRFLPSPLEYIQIILGVPGRQRTPAQKEMMAGVTRRFALRLGVIVACALVLAAGLQWYLSSLRAGSSREQAQSLVEALLDASPEGVPFLLEKLAPLREHAVPILQTRFAEGPAASREKLHAAFGLAAFAEPPEDFLLDAVTETPATECKNLIEALSQVKRSATERLKKAAADLERPVQARMRSAIVLLSWSMDQEAQQFLQIGPDPADRTEFIHFFKDWHGDLRALPGLLSRNTDAGFRYSLCAALGLIEPANLTSDERNRLQKTLIDLFTNAEDGGTHSAARWALERWKIPLPTIESSPKPLQGRKWFVNKLGMTMIEIPAGSFIMGDDIKDAKTHRVTLTKSFFLSDVEVNETLFRRFVEDASDPQAASIRERRKSLILAAPALNLPADRTNWFDAVAFCNWLSRQEGRPEYYSRSGDIQNSAGYRLPTEAEWEYACRAKSTAAFSFGDQSERLTDYGVYLINSPTKRSPIRSKLPNALGLFDMHGSVYEWCEDWHAEYPGDAVDPVGPGQGTTRVYRGGAWVERDANRCRSAMRAARPPNNETGYPTGVRPALTATSEN